jgi:methyl acetate hydrolase
MTLKQALDTVLDYTVNRAGGAPGVAAVATDRNGNIYEGAAGKRSLGADDAMTTDTVMATRRLCRARMRP